MPDVGIAEVIIQVGDLDRAVDFYRSTCGFEHVRTVEHDGARVAEMDADGVRVTLVPAAAPGVRLALETADAAKQRRALRRAHVDVPKEALVEAPGGAWLPFTDPWGNPLGFFEDRSDSD